jgi:hypothetical protein
MRAFAILIFGAAAVLAQPQTDAPKRTIFESQQTQRRIGPPPAAPVKAAAPTRDPGSSAFDALISSTENLNNIRDSNVRRLTEGCSPDVAARIADIRGRLGIRTTAGKRDSVSDIAALALASGWFKSPTENAPVVPQQKKSDLLEAVLPASEKKPEPAEDTANLQTELSRLLAGCSGAKR